MIDDGCWRVFTSLHCDRFIHHRGQSGLCGARWRRVLFHDRVIRIQRDYAVAHRVGAACNIVAAGIYARHDTN
jgi:hypothetical protein